MRPSFRWRRAAALLPTLGLLLVLGAPSRTAPAEATTRDVEVVPAPDAPPGLRLAPAVALTRDVGAFVTWPVTATNGSDVQVDLDLGVHLAAAGEDGAPTPGAGAPWATLPRRTLRLGPGEAATFQVLLTPPADALPTAVVLTATSIGDDARTVLATHVLWPAGHAPDLGLEVATSPGDGGAQQVLVRDDGGPSVVDVRVLGSAWPRRSHTTDAGPLVLLPGVTRVIDVEVPRTVLGSRTEVVVGIEGVEAARLVLGTSAEPAHLALVSLAALAVLGVGVLHQRRTSSPQDASR